MVYSYRMVGKSAGGNYLGDIGVNGMITLK
jgi:hypothetical protein